MSPNSLADDFENFLENRPTLAYIIPRKAASKGGMEKYNTAMMDIQNTFRSSTKVQNKMGVRYTIHGFRTKTAKLDQHRSYIFVVFKVKNSNSNETFFKRTKIKINFGSIRTQKCVKGN